MMAAVSRRELSQCQWREDNFVALFSSRPFSSRPLEGLRKHWLILNGQFWGVLDHLREGIEEASQ